MVMEVPVDQRCPVRPICHMRTEIAEDFPIVRQNVNCPMLGHDLPDRACAGCSCRNQCGIVARVVHRCSQCDAIACEVGWVPSRRCMVD